MKAHYFGSRTKGFTLVITEGPGLGKILSETKVSGKAEARKLAKEKGAEPWNF